MNCPPVGQHPFDGLARLLLAIQGRLAAERAAADERRALATLIMRAESALEAQSLLPRLRDAVERERIVRNGR